jgi:HK97 gp10 family phage protein
MYHNSVDVSSAIKGLENLEKKVGKTYLRKSLRTAAKPTLSLAKSTSPVRTGATQRGIKMRAGRSKKNRISVVVGISRKWMDSATWYGSFEAFGHKAGQIALGASRTQVAPNEWLDKAYEQTASGAIPIFETTIRGLIESGT